MSVSIQSNGSKWAGQAPDSLERLVEVLQTETLDPSFERYGDFVIDEGGDQVLLFGNFLTVSHVFSIRGTRQELEPVIGAILSNKGRDDYRSAREKMLRPHIETFSDLHVTCLRTPQDIEKYGHGYRYLVTERSSAHTAFRTKEGLRQFLNETGLKIKLGHRPYGMRRGYFLAGQYNKAAYLYNPDTWQRMRDSGQYEEIPVLSNGEYTIGLLERSQKGNTIHYLNVNVKERPKLDYGQYGYR